MQPNVRTRSWTSETASDPLIRRGPGPKQEADKGTHKKSGAHERTPAE